MLTLGLAGHCTGRLDRRVNGLGVCSLLNRFVRPAYLGLTNRAIHDLIVAAFFCASGSDFIFPDCFPGSVTLGRDLRLCNGNRITNRAVLALGLAGLCAGGLDCRVSDLGVTLDRDFLLLNENLITDRAMLALGLAGLCTGRLDRRINDLGVTLGRDPLRLGLFTDAAGEGLHAGGGTGCSGGDSTFVPGVILGFGDRCSGCDLLSTALAIGIAGIALLSAGGRLGITNLGLGVHTRRCTAPNAVYIVDRSPGCRTLRLLIAAVPIVQLGRGDGDRRIIWRPVVLNTLIGFAAFARLALLNIYAGALAGADICAVLRGGASGVDGSRRRQRAVDIDLRIDKVVLGAGIALTGRIRNGDKFLISCTTIVAPSLCIINIKVRAVRDLQLRALCNRHRNAWQQGGILADRRRSREDLHVHIVIDGEDIIFRVYTDSHHRQCNAIETCRTLNLKAHTVFCRNIFFGEPTIF